MRYSTLFYFLFLFNDPATTENYTYWPPLSLHDALPFFWLEPGLAFVPHWAFVAFSLLVALPFKAASLYCWPIFAMEISAGTVGMRRARLIRGAAADRKSTRLNSSH